MVDASHGEIRAPCFASKLHATFADSLEDDEALARQFRKRVSSQDLHNVLLTGMTEQRYSSTAGGPYSARSRWRWEDTKMKLTDET